MKIDSFCKFIPEFQEIQVSTINIEGTARAFQASLVSKNGDCLGTGFSPCMDQAKIIAISESIERRLVSNLARSGNANEYLLDLYPSTCGFAVGTTLRSAQERAIAESVERWLRSKWIDEHYYLPKINISKDSLNPIEA